MHYLRNSPHRQKIVLAIAKRRTGMSRQTKPVFTAQAELAFAKKTSQDPKDLGIEFVHFDQDDKPESQHTVPLGKFISDHPLTSEEYLITRSLVAAQASK
jgi:hypothetical protein